MRWQDHIEFNRDVMAGKPVIKGTRITVELLLERLSQGWTDDQIIESFPHITRHDIRAAQSSACAP